MSLPDRRIDPKILKSAEEEFMEKGFADASLRETCKKAGVTTGAMYKRYPGKEALFEAVVGPTLQDIEEMALNIERYDYEQLAHGKMQSVWDMSSTTLKTIVRFSYERYDGFKLLLCRSEGSTHANFLHDFVSHHAKQTVKFLEAVTQQDGRDNQIDEEEIHMLLTAFWSTLFEPIVHDLPLEKALRHCEYVARSEEHTSELQSRFDLVCRLLLEKKKKKKIKTITVKTSTRE